MAQASVLSSVQFQIINDCQII